MMGQVLMWKSRLERRNRVARGGVGVLLQDRIAAWEQAANRLARLVDTLTSCLTLPVREGQGVELVRTWVRYRCTCVEMLGDYVGQRVDEKMVYLKWWLNKGRMLIRRAWL